MIGTRFVRLAGVIVLLMTTGLSVIPAQAVAPANAAFESTWARTDLPVETGEASRTWMWGPEAFTGELDEPYAESPDETRTVQYFDKSRMEITDRDAGSSTVWYVTTGLLAVELITGNLQLGHDSFEAHASAEVNVAGDSDDPTGPTYATFSGLLDAEPVEAGAVLTQRVARNGTLTTDPQLAAHDVTAAQLDAVTGHSVAEPFWAFMNSSGTIYANGSYTTGSLFPDPHYATGRPISEAYWASVKVANTYRDVLMQCFERRCLTYTPDNPEGWQVEAGNVGRHYHTWRYDQIVADPEPTEDPADVLARRPFVPTDQDLFNYSEGEPAPGPGLTEAEIAQDLQAFLERRFPDDPARVDTAMQIFTSDGLMAKVEPAVLRAAIVSLTGTIGEPAIDYIIHSDMSAMRFTDEIGNIGAMVPIQEAVDDDGNLIDLPILVSDGLQYEHFVVLSGMVLHEILHVGDRWGVNDRTFQGRFTGSYFEETIASALGALVDMQQMLTAPDLAVETTLYARGNNRLILGLLNSGIEGRLGIFESNGDVRAGGPDLAIPNFATMYRRTGEVETHGNALLPLLLQEVAGPGVTGPTMPDFDIESLEFLDRNMNVLSPADLITIADLLRLDTSGTAPDLPPVPETGEILVSTGFEEAHSGVDDDGCTFSHSSGSYTIRAIADPGFGRFPGLARNACFEERLAEPGFADVSVSVDIQKLSSGDESFGCILSRYQEAPLDDDTAPAFIATCIDPDRDFVWVSFLNEFDPRDPSQWMFERSIFIAIWGGEAVDLKDDWNRVELIAKGSMFWVRVNGELLGMSTLPSYEGARFPETGGWGVMVWEADYRPGVASRYAFDNLVIRSLADDDELRGTQSLETRPVLEPGSPLATFPNR